MSLDLVFTRTRNGTSLSWPLSATAQQFPEVDVREGDGCRLELRACLNAGQNSEELSLCVSGSRLQPIFVRVEDRAITARWEWPVNFYAGMLPIELLSDERPLWHTTLDVRTHDGKLGRHAYDDLLANLVQRAENVIFGLSAGQRAASWADCPAPPIARLSMLRAHIAGIERGFTGIEACPHRRLVPRREMRPIDQTRRVDIVSMRSISRNPSALCAMGRIDAPVTSCKRPMVDNPRRDQTLNTPPNQRVKIIIHQLTVLCNDLERQLRAAASACVDDVAMLSRLCGMVDDLLILRQRVQRMARAQFLEGVEFRGTGSAATSAMARHPAYARFELLTGRVLRPRLLAATDGVSSLWLRPTYELYEYWCFFTVADVLMGLMPHLKWKSSLCQAPDGLLVAVPDECEVSAATEGRTIRLIFQKTFPAYTPQLAEGNQPFSVSAERRPDIILEVADSAGYRMLALDAKYRCSRSSLHEALGSMHVYRDSLRVSGKNNKLAGAFILTPAHELGARHYYNASYRDIFCIGAFDLSPSVEDGQLMALLAQHVAS